MRQDLSVGHHELGDWIASIRNYSDAGARGLQTEVSTGILERLKAELDAHHPVVALLNLG
jgi:hypothetical protein